MDTVLNSIIILFWSAFFIATIIGLVFSFRKKRPNPLIQKEQEPASADALPL